jgi:hypothetical protein
MIPAIPKPRYLGAFFLTLSLLFGMTIGTATAGQFATAVSTVECGSEPNDIGYIGQDLVLISAANGLFKATNTGWDFVNSSGALPTVGTGGSLYLYTVPEIQQSLDGGESWTATGSFTLTENFTYERLFASPLTNTIFMSVMYTWGYTGPYKGIYKSSDSGLTWHKVITGDGATPVVFSPNFIEDGIAFAGGGELWKTTDWGETWFLLDYLGGAPGTSARQATDTPTVITPPTHILVSPQFAQDQTVFRINEGFVWKSTDGGVTWMKAPPLPGGWYESGAAISPNYLRDQTLVVADQYYMGIFISRDGAQSWQLTNFPLQPLNVGIRLKGPYGPWPFTSPISSGSYRTYLPVIQSAGQERNVEMWAIGRDSIWNSYLMRSSDAGFSWETVCVFEASHWQYLPVVTRASSSD